MNTFFTTTNLADILGVSFRTVTSWINSGKFRVETDSNGRNGFSSSQLKGIPEIDDMVHSKWEAELMTQPLRQYNSIELFAGGGGLATRRAWMSSKASGALPALRLFLRKRRAEHGD